MFSTKLGLTVTSANSHYGSVVVIYRNLVYHSLNKGKVKIV